MQHAGSPTKPQARQTARSGPRHAVRQLRLSAIAGVGHHGAPSASAAPAAAAAAAPDAAAAGGSASASQPPLLRQPECVQVAPPVQPRRASIDGSQEWIEEIDVLGLGQLMIDFSACVDDGLLAELQLEKGGRRVVSVEERAAVMERLRGHHSQVSAGGSLANSLVGIAQLAAARLRSIESRSQQLAPHQQQQQQQPRRIRVAMAGCCGGSDALGEYGRAQLAAAGVDIISVDAEEEEDAEEEDEEGATNSSSSSSSSSCDDGAAAAAAAGRQSGCWAGSATGTVMVLTTPDAQRSFLSSFSAEDNMQLTPRLLAAVAAARVVVVEGYLWELPGAAEVIPAVVAHARSVGTLTVLTAGDASVVRRHGARVLAAIRGGVDMLVCNEAEAAALVQQLRDEEGEQEQEEQPAAAAVVAAVAAAEQQQQQHLEHVQLAPQGSMEGSVDGDSAASAALQHASTSEAQVAACALAGVCPMVVVTDGSRGSLISAVGQLIVVPPYWRAAPPVDTCGAGDAYFSGLLWAFLAGGSLHELGHVAAKTASAVISRRGPQLQPADADWVAATPAHSLGGSSLAARFMSGSGPVQQAVQVAAQS